MYVSQKFFVLFGIYMEIFCYKLDMEEEKEDFVEEKIIGRDAWERDALKKILGRETL